METFQFKLISPERLLFSDAVKEVILPGSDGYLTIMVNHSPMMTRVIPGIIRVKIAEGVEKVFVIFGGYADITFESCSVLVEFVMLIEDLDLQDVERRIVNARSEFERATITERRNKAEDFFYQLISVQDACALIKKEY